MEQHIRCPYCAAPLSLGAEACVCLGCHKIFPVVFGIPDLRVPADAWIDFEEDRAFAISIAEHYHTETFESLIVQVLKHCEGDIPQEIVNRRIVRINEAQSKYAEDLSAAGWIGSLLDNSSGRSCVELGCGMGAFLAAAANHFDFVIGLDISLSWLIAAKKRLEGLGLNCSLVCACVERLPLQSDKFDLTVALDVIEHVTDARQMFEEVGRVTRPGGRVACTTPNRFSLSAEPHVGVWGVGFVPRKWMPAYVRWRNGMLYRYTYPKSLFGLRQLFKRQPEFDLKIKTPTLWEGEVKAFSPTKRIFAQLYNQAIRLRILRSILLPVAPFFYIIAQKRPDAPNSRRN
ncbi:MAG: class I SAM-dependent methyltransferase [Acidobacteria bacterium]|nr:class I SAM-dependent methyltransferase [Acidobacteriota bacterium]